MSENYFLGKVEGGELLGIKNMQKVCKECVKNMIYNFS